MALHCKALAPDVIGARPDPIGIALGSSVFDGEVGAGLLKKKCVALRGSPPLGDRWQRLDIDVNFRQCVLSERSALGQRHGDGFADITDLVAGDDRLVKWFENRQRLQPDRDPRHR